jgi:hypothetical protein
LHGAAECVSTINHWILRGDPREAAKLWKSTSDFEVWDSMDYDDRARFSDIVDPYHTVFEREHPNGREEPFLWPVISLITLISQGCLMRRPCRLLLLHRVRPGWYGLSSYTTSTGHGHAP